MKSLRARLYYLGAYFQGTPFTEALASSLERQHWSSADLSSWQSDHLQRLLSHAKQQVPAYSAIRLASADALAAFATLPLLTKDYLRHNAYLLTSRDASRKAVRKTTGGSTGAPVTVLKSRQAMSFELAAAWRGMRWAGISPGTLQARFWGMPHQTAAYYKARLTDIVAHRIRCSAFAFTERDLDLFHRLLLHRQPAYCYGYASMLYEFAAHLLDNNYDVPSSIRAIISTAEPLSADQRKTIEEAFHVAVYDEYGCGELGTIAHECSHGSLHINADNLYVETIDDQGRACPPGTPGTLVVTDLHNYAMPLIRYAIADNSTVSPNDCPCRITLPTLAPVTGRAYDMFINTEGKRYHGEYFLYIFEDLKRRGLPVENYRLTQHAPSCIELELVSRDRHSISTIADAVLRELRATFDKSVTLDTVQRDYIPREASGKYRLLKRTF